MHSTILFGGIGSTIIALLMSGTAVFLILIILVQRGRGGGLSGALGGMGGQSAFGTKAGDAFTKLTIGVSIAWILLCILAVRFLSVKGGEFGDGPAITTSAPGDDDDLTAPSTSLGEEDLGLGTEIPAVNGENGNADNDSDDSDESP